MQGSSARNSIFEKFQLHYLPQLEAPERRASLHNPFWSPFRPKTPISLGHRIYLIKAVFGVEGNLVDMRVEYILFVYTLSDPMVLSYSITNDGDEIGYL